jgi:hypothetical protein
MSGREPGLQLGRLVDGKGDDPLEPRWALLVHY